MFKQTKKMMSFCLSLISIQAFAANNKAPGQTLEALVLAGINETAQMSDEEIAYASGFSDYSTKALALRVTLARTLVTAGLYNSVNNAAKYVAALEISEAESLLKFLKSSALAMAEGAGVPTN